MATDSSDSPQEVPLQQDPPIVRVPDLSKYQQQDASPGTRNPDVTEVVTREVNCTDRQLQKKYDHAAVFNLPDNYNKENAGRFKEAITAHVNAETTQHLDGVYTRGVGPQNVTFHVDVDSRVVVVTSEKQDFITAERLSAKQLWHVQHDRKLGGGA